jgi:hypothetical protein
MHSAETAMEREHLRSQRRRSTTSRPIPLSGSISRSGWCCSLKVQARGWQPFRFAGAREACVERQQAQMTKHFGWVYRKRYRKPKHSGWVFRKHYYRKAYDEAENVTGLSQSEIERLVDYLAEALIEARGEETR